ncbi:MAG: hypothetical protein AAB484_00200 [Patescibacteria group bacterium]
MGNSNPYQAAQAALVLNHLVLDINQVDAEALTRFCNDPQSDERVQVRKFFTVSEKTRLLLEITKVTIPVTTEKKTKDCFLGDRYCYRDSDLDNLLAKVQPTGMAGQFTVHQLEKELNFKEVAQAILGVDEAPLNDLAKGIIEKGHTVVLPQIESLIERTDTGENTGLRTDGYANFFFVINKEGGVSVVNVPRYGGRRWNVYVYHFGNGLRWDVEHRFFSRNS